MKNVKRGHKSWLFYERVCEQLPRAGLVVPGRGRSGTSRLPCAVSLTMKSMKGWDGPLTTAYMMTISSDMANNTSKSFEQPTNSNGLIERQRSRKVVAKEKQDGIHYTPPVLANFLSRHVAEGLKALTYTRRPIYVLDPACGNGELLRALAAAVPANIRSRLVLKGFDKDMGAVEQAKRTLSTVGALGVELHCADFLEIVTEPSSDSQMSLTFTQKATQMSDVQEQFDAVISNPPYVRTQVLGAKSARKLAKQFDLAGRVDLYHAFVKAMTSALHEGGILGLLTSNRFLFIQSGASVREWLLHNFRLKRLVDLGDTKLFSAAVLPAILVAERSQNAKSDDCDFVRVYECSAADQNTYQEFNTILDALDGSFTGTARINNWSFDVKCGLLHASIDGRAPWRMISRETETWLATVKNHSVGSFSHFGKVCVGIKSTADTVFVRDDWETIPITERPEEALLRPLITHHLASRWTVSPNRENLKRVLYPYEVVEGKRTPINLDEYPRARAYLERHRDILEQRTYVIESGRKWYEIWVPHHPHDWSLPKLAFPDISVSNTFFVVDQNWVVNGDCYWIKLLPGVKEQWLWIMLATANSSFVLKYYDIMFHNKLYSGRRRFMSQYVGKFPLPRIDKSAPLLDLMPQLLKAARANQIEEVQQLQLIADELVWKAFGLPKEITRQRNL